ncbi:MAG: chemotaxis protein CheC [Candidatus Thermoplasmatota archaeon]|nr:chemotaxis protein CheC [Candidatus Thermoplasmatota archaeon]
MTDEKTGKVLGVIMEFANIGAGSAATALSSLMDVELMNEVTSCNILPMSKVSDWLGGADQIVAGTYTYLCGDLKSGILVVLPNKSAVTLLEHLTKEKVDIASLTELQKSALKEVGNICLCWYLIAVSKMIDIDMIPAPPDATVDLLGAVLDIPLASLAQKVDTVLAVHTCFKGIDEEFEGYFLMLPEESTLKLILERMVEPRR